MVQEIIHKEGKWPHYDKPMLKLRACWEGNAIPFGCGYTCAIGDTVTEGAVSGSMIKVGKSASIRQQQPCKLNAAAILIPALAIGHMALLVLRGSQLQLCLE